MKSLIPKTITVIAIALLTIQTTTAQTTVQYKTGWVAVIGIMVSVEIFSLATLCPAVIRTMANSLDLSEI